MPALAEIVLHCRRDTSTVCERADECLRARRTALKMRGTPVAYRQVRPELAVASYSGLTAAASRDSASTRGV